MNELFTAIMTKFNATSGGLHNSFYTAVGGQLYHEQAPQGISMPYSVFHLITTTDEPYFSSAMENAILQFNIFSNARSAADIGNATRYLKALFHDCALTISSVYTFLSMEREFFTIYRDEQDTYWQSVSQFRIRLKVI